jgi:hypothetical protein
VREWTEDEGVKEAEMRTGEDDDSAAAAPTPRGETPGKSRRRVDRTVTRRGR